MLAPQRHEVILRELKRSGAIRVSDLVALLGVSDMTVRRDFEVLAQRGLLDKVHGGATLPQDSSSDEPGFEAKSTRQLTEKEAIGARAANLVEPGSAIALSAGTTTHVLAHHLRDIAELTIVTNSIQVAVVFANSGRPDQTVVLTGGVRTPSDALVGPVAVAAIQSLHVDMAFMGTHGIDLKGGLTTPNLMEAETNQALLQSARRVTVVADHTKWGIVGLSTFARLDEIDLLVTDDGMPPEARNRLVEHVGDLIITTTREQDAS